MGYIKKEIYMTKQTKTAIATSGLKVIGAGFGRTGTLSIKAALEELGFGPCYHMTEVFGHQKHIPLWDAAARGETVNWQELLKGYQATVDWPSCTFYKELMEVYPDAKVLLTVRDPEKWYESAQSTIYQTVSWRRSPSSSLILRLFGSHILQTAGMINTLIWERTFRGNFADKHYAIEIFNQHIEEVKKYVPPEQLLVYNVKEGWEPLCAFLGVEVPEDKPFPHLNDRANFTGRRRWQRLRPIIVQRALIAASILLSLFFILSRFRKTLTQR
jgi:sulfotransferase family protein